MAKKKRVRLSEFLRRMYDDPKLLRQFKVNPKATAAKAGLSPKHLAIVISGDPRAIGHALVDEHVDAHEAGEVVHPVTFGLGWIVFPTGPRSSSDT